MRYFYFKRLAKNISKIIFHINLIVCRLLNMHDASTALVKKAPIILTAVSTKRVIALPQKTWLILNQLILAISFMTNKIIRSCIFRTKSKYVWMLKTYLIHFDLSWGRRQRTKKVIFLQVIRIKLFEFIKG